MSLLIFLPQQLQGQTAMLLKLLGQDFPIRLWPLRRSYHHRRSPEQLDFQFLFAQNFG
jgi:hypothetical protein